MNQTVEILTNAKQILIDKGWTQNVLARNQHGIMVWHTESEAVCFCSVGAIDRATFDLIGESQATNDVVRTLRCALPEGQTSIAAYNDSHTFEEVIEMFNNAIGLAKEAENA